MPHRKQWSDLTPKSRDRASRMAAEQFGLTRKQARERYNRGTFKPFAKNPIARIPKNAPYYPVAIGRDLKTAAITNFDKQIGDYFSYNRLTVLDAVEHHATDEALARMAGATEDELTTWAQAQTSRHKGRRGSAEKTPAWLRTLGWTDEKGKWHNVFWYH